MSKYFTVKTGVCILSTPTLSQIHTPACVMLLYSINTMCYHLHLPVIINFDYVRARRKGRGSRSKARIGPKRKSHHKPDETLTSLSLPSEWITDVEAPCG